MQYHHYRFGLAIESRDDSIIILVVKVLNKVASCNHLTQLIQTTSIE